MLRFNFSNVLLIIFLIFASMVAYYLGWIQGSNLLTLMMSILGLVGLLLIIKLPWDLYFEARYLLAEQSESIRRGIEIPEEDHTYTQKMEKKLLMMCISLHILSASAIGLATYYSGGFLGYYFAGFYLLSTFFRPIASFYVMQRQRFASLRSRCKVPREDAINFAMRIEELERGFKEFQKSTAEGFEDIEGQHSELSAELRAARSDGSAQFRQLDQKLDQVLNEFTRSIEKLTEDKELLRGIRAFVKVIKEESS